MQLDEEHINLRTTKIPQFVVFFQRSQWLAHDCVKFLQLVEVVPSHHSFRIHCLAIQQLDKMLSLMFYKMAGSNIFLVLADDIFQVKNVISQRLRLQQHLQYMEQLNC